MEQLKYFFDVELGDPSGDGHGKTEKFAIASNIPVEKIISAYAKALENGFPDITTAVEEYENHWVESSFTEEFFRALARNSQTLPKMSTEDHLGLCERLLKVTKFRDAKDATMIPEIAGIHGYILEDQGKYGPYMRADDVICFYMFIVKTVEHDLHYEIDSERQSIELGGYGLYE